jgi:DnaJ-class molecular chaperone
MKAKYINEAFDEETDPIDDMEIGRVKCPQCQGEGSYPDHDQNSIDPRTGEHDCRYCPIEVECETCEGTGYVSKKKKKEYEDKSISHIDDAIDIPF